jgi:hypothetical protein
MGPVRQAATYMRVNVTQIRVRHLSTTMQIVEKRALPLYKMNLESLELDCGSVPALSLAASTLLVFPHVPDTLVSLGLTSLPRITQLLLEEIAMRCANLRELRLSVVERLSTDCCWACFEELSCCVTHSPVDSDASPGAAGPGDLAVGDRSLPRPSPANHAHAGCVVSCSMLGAFGLWQI